jgi:TRAP-type C4-dicarboxylate transport system permease small subunit
MTTDAHLDTGWLARTVRIFERIAMLLLVAMTALIVIQVVGRNVFNTGLSWAEELARYCGLGVVYLTVPLLLLHDKHIKVELLPARLGGGSKRALELVNELLVLAFCLVFLTAGWMFLKRAAQFSTAAMGIPNWLYYLPAAVGMVLLTLVAASRVVRLGKGSAAS